MKTTSTTQIVSSNLPKTPSKSTETPVKTPRKKRVSKQKSNEAAQEQTAESKKTTTIQRKRTSTSKVNEVVEEQEQKPVATPKEEPKKAIVSVPKTTKKTSPKKRTSKAKKESINFYKIDTDKDGIYKGFTIKMVEYVDFIKDLGFFRYDLENGVCLFVHVENKVVRMVQPHEITDRIISEVRRLEGCEYVTSKMVIEKLYGNLGRYFSTPLLQRLTTDIPFEFVKDSKGNAYFYFKNGIVVCSSKGYELKPYSQFNKHIWKEQIKPNDFILLQDTAELLHNSEKAKEIEVPFIYEYGNFARYCFLLAGTSERFFSLCSLLGYIIHDFTDYKLQSVILTDSSISDNGEANGRSGKSLLFKSLENIRNIVHILGKDFDPTSKHKYDKAKPDSQIVFIDDLKRKFDVEDLFNDITEGITVDAKNQQPYKLKTKIIGTTNKPLKIEGGSAQDRFIEFEVTSFFSPSHRPEDEFEGQWFFRDWDTEEWNKYYNFMLFCICYFLKNGVQKPATINLAIRKLQEETQLELIEFLDDKIETGKLKGIHLKIELFDEFRELYTDFQYKLTQRKFTEYVRKYCLLSPLYAQFYTPFSKAENEKKPKKGHSFEFFLLSDKEKN